VNLSSFVIVTGLSGSGKGTFLKALEDRGYFCVDNLPVELLGKFYELTLKSEGEGTKVALGIDVREGKGLNELPAMYAELRNQPGVSATLWFLEASDPVIVRRFSETRRPHPLDPGKTVMESIREERTLLAPIRAAADRILDTSQFTIHDLRKQALTLFQELDGRHLLASEIVDDQRAAVSFELQRRFVNLRVFVVDELEAVTCEFATGPDHRPADLHPATVWT